MDDSDYDYTQGSLCEEVKVLLAKHDAAAAAKNELRSPVESNEGRSSPMTVLQAGDVHGSEPTVSGAGGTGDIGDKPGQRRYISITETLEENRKLKAEVLNLKSDIYLLKSELPALKNAKGVDFTQEFLVCKKQVYNEQKARREQELELKVANEELKSLRSTFEAEHKKWDDERNVLVSRQNKLNERLEEATKDADSKTRALMRAREELQDLQSAGACESDVSQSGNSTLSLVSDRGFELDRLQSLVLKTEADAEQARQDFVRKIDELVADVQKKESELKVLSENFQAEKAHSREVETENARIQGLLEGLEKERKLAQDELDEVIRQQEKEILKRDKAIKALIRRYNGAESVNLSEGQKAVPDSEAAIIPAVAGILHHVQEIDEKNIRIREKAIEIATADGSFEDPTASSGILSTDDEASDLSVAKLMKKNARIAEYISSTRLKQRKSMGMSQRGEVERKMAEFDAEDAEDEENRDRFSTSQVLNISAPNDLLNISRCISQDVTNLKRKLSAFRSICVRLFEKLRGSASSLQKILGELYGNEEGKTILGEIDALRIDLDQSVNAADSLFNEFGAFQKSVLEFTDVFEQSIRPQLYDSLSHNKPSDNLETAGAVERCQTVEALLEVERQKIVDAEGKIKELTGKISNLDEEKNQFRLERKAAEDRMVQLDAEMKLIVVERDELRTRFCNLQQKVDEYQQIDLDKNRELSKLRQELHVKEAEFVRYKTYFEELTRVEAESRKLAQSLKEMISTLPRRVAEFISGQTNAKEEGQACCNEIQADGHVIELRNEYAQMRLAIKESESKSASLEVELNRQLGEIEDLKKENDRYAQRCSAFEKKANNVHSIAAQTDLNANDFARREAEYERCFIENGISKENAEKLYSAISQLENERGERGDVRSGECSCAAKQTRRHFCFPKSACTMTELSSKDIEDLQQRFNEYQQSVKDFNGHTAKKTKVAAKAESAVAGMQQSEADKSDNEFSGFSLASSDQVSNRDAHSELSDPVSSECSPVLLWSELARGHWTRIHYYSDELVQFLKKWEGQNLTKETWEKLMHRVRSLRYKIQEISMRVSQVEKIKENVSPDLSPNALREEVISLRMALADANELLKKADGKLAKQPNTDSIRNLIVDEMARIRDVLKATRREVRRLEQRPSVNT